jgi:hypothetical protein
VLQHCLVLLESEKAEGERLVIDRETNVAPPQFGVRIAGPQFGFSDAGDMRVSIVTAMSQLEDKRKSEGNPTRWISLSIHPSKRFEQGRLKMHRTVIPARMESSQ